MRESQTLTPHIDNKITEAASTGYTYRKACQDREDPARVSVSGLNDTKGDEEKTAVEK